MTVPPDRPRRWALRVRDTRRAARLTAAALLLAGCASTPQQAPENLSGAEAGTPPQRDDAPAPAALSTPDVPATGPGDDTPLAQRFPGTGRFIGAAAARTERAAPAADAVTLNFQDTEVAEVVQSVLGDMLGENYVIEPDLRSRITLQTSRPLERRDLPALLESALDLNGLALVRDDGLYRVVRREAASRTVTPAGIGRQNLLAGYQLRAVPLRYVAAAQMTSLLGPLAPDGAVRYTDSARNLLVIAGTAAEVRRMLDVVEIFDVDWLAGMSVALVPLRYADPTDVAADLAPLLTEADSPIDGMIRLVPIERSNALLVVTPQPAYLDVAESWIRRLDRGEDPETQRLFVYPVQNGRAEELAQMLNELFGGRGSDDRRMQRDDTLAPGRNPIQLRAEAGSERDHRPRSEQDSDAGNDHAGTTRGPNQARGHATTDGDRVRIIAEPANNALVILATPDEYRNVEAAVRRLDVVPLQVLVEATIVEVTLTGELSYGIQWFFQQGLAGGRYQATGQVGQSLAFSPSFAYTLTNAADDIRLLLRALATDDKIKVLSSPSLTVLDNQTATIRVGDQQPVATSIIGIGGVVSETVQFKDTGVILEVTPRVNAGGLVRMDIRQEVTDVGDIDAATGQRGFLQRTINSRVAVQSDETVVLGGLIRDNASAARSGVPLLHRIPIVGALFGQRVNTSRRTELLVLIRPRAIRDASEARAVTDELRHRMRSLEPFLRDHAPAHLLPERDSGD